MWPHCGILLPCNVDRSMKANNYTRCRCLKNSIGIGKVHIFFYLEPLVEVVEVLGREDLGCVTKKKATATPDSLLWPKVIYSVQARRNDLSPGKTVMFMYEYMTLIHTLKPVGENG